jgi:DNA-binding transcriptional regulator YiaG
MDTESHWVYERMKLYELMQQQPGLSNRQYARYLQHDPKWVRKWRQRFHAATPGNPGQDLLQSVASTPVLDT